MCFVVLRWREEKKMWSFMNSSMRRLARLCETFKNDEKNVYKMLFRQHGGTSLHRLDDSQQVRSCKKSFKKFFICYIQPSSLSTHIFMIIWNKIDDDNDDDEKTHEKSQIISDYRKGKEMEKIHVRRNLNLCVLKGFSDSFLSLEQMKSASVSHSQFFDHQFPWLVQKQK